MVAHLDGTVRRIDDIGEQHGCQNPLKVGLLTLPLPGDEFLDLPAQLGHIALEESVSPVRVFDIPRAGNLRGKIAAVLPGTRRSFTQCSTKVGTRMFARIGRTSMRAFCCNSALNAPGLALRRSSLAN